MEERSKIEAFKIETPLVTIESDSGNHALDLVSVFAAVFVLYILKRLYYT